MDEHNRLSSAPPEIKNFFELLLKYRIDPSGGYYGITHETLSKELTLLANNNAVAVDSEYRYNGKKGLAYDPILESFIQGSGGHISNWEDAKQLSAPAVIRGITKRTQMESCRLNNRDFFYIDTGYFGNNSKRKLYHRITRNDVQNFGPVLDRPSDRWDKINHKLIGFTPGSKVLLAPPSQKLLNLYDINLETWLDTTIETIKKHTDREIVVRLKQGRSIRVSDDTMEMALADDIHCLVTFSSIAATEALLYGKPAFNLGPNAATPLCLQDLRQIEHPYIPHLDEVHAWASHLAYCQFTEFEMRNGTAWAILNDDYRVRSKRIRRD